jgi:thiol-disulfide isomerase/thioredoxin
VPSVSPHSGDTHREGAILPDTFTGIDFGLVDSDQDMGAGEEGVILQPAPPESFRDPFPVFSLSSDLANSSNYQLSLELCGDEGSKLAPQCSGLRSVSLSNPLTLDCGPHIPSQVSGHQSFVEEFDKDDSTMKRLTPRLQLELPTEFASDTVWLTYWDKLLVEHAELTPGTTIPLVAERGDFFSGTAEQSVYRWYAPLDSLVYLSVRGNSGFLFRHLVWFPGDQVRIRINPITGRALIQGQQSEFFEAQFELSRLGEQYAFTREPLIVSGSPERLLSDSLNRRLYDQSHQNKSPISPAMNILVPGKNEKEILSDLIKTPLTNSDLAKRVSNLTSGLDSERRNWLSQRAWAYLGSSFFPRINLGKSLFSDSLFADLLQERLDEFYLPQESELLDPIYAKQLSDLMLIQARLEQKGLKEISSKYSPKIREFFWATYALNNFNRLEEKQGEVLNLAINQSQSPWVRKLLLERKETALQGSPVTVDPLLGWDDAPLDLAQFEGKTMVISFWITGCKFCMAYYENTLLPVFEQFKDRDDIVFISVNADLNRRYWKESVATGRYSHLDMIQGHQDSGTGILKTYRIASFPQKLLINSDFEVSLLTSTQYTPEELTKKLLEISDSKTHSEIKP